MAFGLGGGGAGACNVVVVLCVLMPIQMLVAERQRASAIAVQLYHTEHMILYRPSVVPGIMFWWHF